MRTNLNFSPLFRSTIGFDRVFDLSGKRQPDPELRELAALRHRAHLGDSYRITMAVAGFAESELTITHQPNLLIVAGNKAEMEGEYLHHGIPSSEFERRFELADHVKVAQADLQNGLLSISARARSA